MIIKSKKLQTITQDTSKQLQTTNLYGVAFTVIYHPEHDDYILRRNDGTHERNFSVYSIEDKMRDCNPLTKWQVVDRPQPLPVLESKSRKDSFSQTSEEFEANWQAEREREHQERILMLQPMVDRPQPAPTKQDKPAMPRQTRILGLLEYIARNTNETTKSVYVDNLRHEESILNLLATGWIISHNDGTYSPTVKGLRRLSEEGEI